MRRHGPLHEVRNLFLIVCGVLCAGMGLNGFLAYSNFIDGGVTGISMLLAKISSWPLALLLPLVNLPFILVAYRLLGSVFAMRSVLGIAGLALALYCIPYPLVTSDLVLIAIFGGMFIGAGIGLAMRGGAVLDGTEIAALLISKWVVQLRVGDIILLFNVSLFLAAISVLGVDSALYSIATYFSAAKTLDFVLYGIDEYTAVTIISEHSALIREAITSDLKRGVTVYRGYGGKSGMEQEIVHCVLTRLELGKVRSMVQDIDPAAFLFFHPLAGAEGGVIKSRIGH